MPSRKVKILSSCHDGLFHWGTWWWCQVPQSAQSVRSPIHAHCTVHTNTPDKKCSYCDLYFIGTYMDRENFRSNPMLSLPSVLSEPMLEPSVSVHDTCRCCHKQGRIYVLNCIPFWRVCSVSEFFSFIVFYSFHPILTFGWLTPPSVWQNRKTLLFLRFQPAAHQGHRWILTAISFHWDRLRNPDENCFVQRSFLTLCFLSNVIFDSKFTINVFIHCYFGQAWRQS